MTIIKPNKYPIESVAEDNITSSQAAEVVEPTPILEPAEVERPYKRKCTQAIKAYGLTPREGEILFYLAKGRNAKHIAERLYVADRTVKTHTYHIYQKMGIHSQQELMDIVENIEG
ncbi:helix-turn-helix transcriptional regulator [Adlercreutzia sp. ZJ473]|uniref:helix-turn-helix transcriptional regulator n=1 Tax=Adlercreutzia sp. ZJ473 TaxID=2722822 RepID=UPI0020A6C71B|nr:helix-turn-helix transcriptional regulator [Adlercreutzia sp. ZJ473]